MKMLLYTFIVIYLHGMACENSETTFTQHNSGDARGVFYQNSEHNHYLPYYDWILNDNPVVHSSFQQETKGNGPTYSDSKNYDKTPALPERQHFKTEEFDSQSMARVPGLFNIGSRWNKPRVVTTSVSTTFFFLTSYLTTSTVTNLMLQRCLDLDQFATDKIIVQCSRRKRGDRQFLNPSKNIDKIEITRGFLESVDHNARGGYYQQNSNPNPINEESDPRYLDLLSSREIGTSPRSFYNSFRSDTPTLILTSLLTITIPTSYTFELSTFVQKVTLLPNDNDTDTDGTSDKKDRLQCIPIGYKLCD